MTFLADWRAAPMVAFAFIRRCPVVEARASRTRLATDVPRIAVDFRANVRRFKARCKPERH
jgi:hypothetical protein